jgi:UDP-glucuronate decarboxylase
VLTRRAVEYPQQGPFSIKGRGEETRSYCYISDVLDSMLLAMAKVDGCGLLGPLNIGSEKGIRIIDLARQIADISGKGMEVVRLPGPSSVWSQAMDCSKSKQLLDGWEPKVSLREGLTRTYTYWEARLNDAVKANG